ncbi:MAG: hypothetical protein ACM3VZ_14075 [Acidobacteriota bacterium]
MNTLIAMLLIMAAGVARAHGGEDHDHDAPTAAIAAAAPVGTMPRATAQTEAFELVAVLQGTPPTLTLYVDRFDSNEPVAGATVELESGAFKAVAKPLAPGVYTVPGQAFSQPGRYPLTVSVQTDDAADLLDAILQYEAPVAPHAPSTRGWGRLAGWGAAALVALALGGLAWRRLARRT